MVGADGELVAAGETGEIVVTHLATRDFPFIRYRTGDVGSLANDDCKCGRGLPTLAKLQGRTTDFVVARDGTVMHGLALIYAVRDLPGIAQFRIVQHDLDHTEVELVTGAAYRNELDERIRADFRARLGADVQVSVRHVASIPPEASGKHRYVISRVPSARGQNTEAACA